MKHTFGHRLNAIVRAERQQELEEVDEVTKAHRSPALRQDLISLPGWSRWTLAAAGNPAEILELPTIDVVGITPLPGLGTRLRDVPANVQIITSKDLAKQRQSNFADYLEQNPTSVTTNAGQGNPFQPDINFRGFSGSPLFGTPQGVSVFQDGVRVNEPFGDVVNWDLIPQSAISTIQLIPGSNPAFGLNTLGGALAIYTKSGSQYPGGAVSASVPVRRKTAEFELRPKTTSTTFSPATISTTRAGPTTTRAVSNNSSARSGGRMRRPIWICRYWGHKSPGRDPTIPLFLTTSPIHSPTPISTS
jgi:outer membrane receptor for Fe3+-dicitrate